MYIILTKACRILHCFYHDVYMFIVTYFIAVCLKEMLVSAPWIWQDNSAETHKNCVKDCTHKLRNSFHIHTVYLNNYQSFFTN